MLPDFGISSSLKYGRSVVWQATKIVRFLKYVRNLSLRWNRALFFRRGWAPSLLWIAYRTLCPEIVFHLNSEFFGMKISTWRVDGIRKTQEESLIFQRKNDLNLKGVISLKHIFSLKRQCFCEDSFVEGLLKQLFLSRKRFFSKNHHRHKLRAQKASRGSRLFCFISQPVFSLWASSEFPLIEFLCFQPFPSEQQCFYYLRT